MKRAIHPALICSLLLTLVLSAAAESAKSLYAKGKIAEARQNYEQAYDFFKQAYVEERGVPCEEPRLDGEVVQEVPAGRIPLDLIA